MVINTIEVHGDHANWMLVLKYQHPLKSVHVVPQLQICGIKKT
jgi:hypothetical protein